MSFPWVLSLVVGFLSLSQEILWVRLISFVQGGAPVAFAFVLSCYLVGIALGAAIGKIFCDRAKDLYGVAALVLLLAAATDPLPPFLGDTIAYRGGAVTWLQVVPPALAIILTAAIKSILFPIAHHLGSNQSGPNVGSSVSNIYFGNIIGATLGPIVTGFFVLDWLTVDDSFRLVGALSLLMAILCALRSPFQRRIVTLLGGAAAVALFSLMIPASDFVRSAAERFAEGTAREPVYGEISQVVQNKHGVIHTVALPGRRDDMVYGGNVYDGRINTNIKNDTNGIGRVYLLAALHPNPKRILVVGMSTGAWTQVVAGFPGVEKIDVVEINKGYVDVMRRHPEVTSILDNPKVSLHFDDGRRWLKRHPDERYDMIVMNTTFHWRAYSTNLLSLDFLREVSHHLNRPAGLLTFNTTQSLDAFKTAERSCPFVYRYLGFAYAGFQDFKVDASVARDRLTKTTIDGRPVFESSDFATGAIGDKLANAQLEPVAELLARHAAPAEVITDVNMLSEFRHGKRVGIPLLDLLLPPRHDMLVKDK